MRRSLKLAFILFFVLLLSSCVSSTNNSNKLLGNWEAYDVSFEDENGVEVDYNFYGYFPFRFEFKNDAVVRWEVCKYEDNGFTDDTSILTTYYYVENKDIYVMEANPLFFYSNGKLNYTDQAMESVYDGTLLLRITIEKGELRYTLERNDCTITIKFKKD
jgi:hypothetical protein